MATAAAKKAVPKAAPPEKFEPELVPEPVESPTRLRFKPVYPEGARLYWYQPTGGGDEFPLPLDLKRQPDKLFYWDLDEVKANPWIQLKRYLDFFEVPKVIQRHAYDVLSDGELMDMCNGWLRAISGGTSVGE